MYITHTDIQSGFYSYLNNTIAPMVTIKQTIDIPQPM